MKDISLKTNEKTPILL